MVVLQCSPRGILDANEWYKYKGPITDEMVQEYTGQ